SAVVATALIAAIAISIALLGGIRGVAYVALLVLTAVPGLPLGFALFGKRHVVSLLTGATLGYAIASLAWWAVVFFGHASTWAFVDAWVFAALVSWAIARAMDSPFATLPRWTRSHSVALMLLLLLVPALLTRPFARLGSVDRDGHHLYRAYFIADFVWHTALTAELAKEESRPRNPFLATERVHYY